MKETILNPYLKLLIKRSSVIELRNLDDCLLASLLPALVEEKDGRQLDLLDAVVIEGGLKLSGNGDIGKIGLRDGSGWGW